MAPQQRANSREKQYPSRSAGDWITVPLRVAPSGSGKHGERRLLALGGSACIAQGLPMFGAKRPRHKSMGSSAHDPKQK
jgi:hypothetical protein